MKLRMKLINSNYRMQLATINYWQRIKQAYPTRQDTATKTDSTSPARDETKAPDLSTTTNKKETSCWH